MSDVIMNRKLIAELEQRLEQARIEMEAHRRGMGGAANPEVPAGSPPFEPERGAAGKL